MVVSLFTFKESSKGEGFGWWVSTKPPTGQKDFSLNLQVENAFLPLCVTETPSMAEIIKQLIRSSGSV